MGYVVVIGFFAAPMLFALIHLFFIIPWYVMLTEFSRLTYFRLYLLSYVSALSAWLFIANEPKGITYHDVFGPAVVIGLVMLWVISLFWLFSYKKEKTMQP
jgi:hypothetical protein